MTIADTKAADTLAETVWTTPSSYFGFSPVGHYCVMSITRDASNADLSNWYAMRRVLQDAGADIDDSDVEPRTAPVYTWRASHWACGWVEYLMIQPDASDAILYAAAEALDALADYPLLDDEDHSKREYDAICEAWESASLPDRMDYCREAGVSIFAARRENDIPEAVFDHLAGTGAYV